LRSWAASVGSSRTFPSSRPAVGVPPSDRRIWAFGAGVLVLLLLGVLVGKSVSTPRVTAGPPAHHTGAASGTHAGAAAVPTTVPTPLPTPTPPPSPTVLTGAKTLGSPSSGFLLDDLRYGTHPNDFRIVLDFNGANARGAAPTVIAGFGDPTTLYIELAGVGPAAATPVPQAGNTVTAVRLLLPSPVAGRTVYELTLAHPVKLSAYYLLNPVRLVIDLTS
jgi:hypothetical protein